MSEAMNLQDECFGLLISHPGRYRIGDVEAVRAGGRRRVLSPKSARVVSWTVSPPGAGRRARGRGGIGARSAGLIELGDELRGREDRKVVGDDEQVVAAGHQVRAPADC